ncbi:MAG: hypothetical protein QXD34_01820, partial [Candidatus Bathyarchaeia archaeon]
PVEWVKAEKIMGLEDFFEKTGGALTIGNSPTSEVEGGSHIKDVQNVHYVHPSPNVDELLKEFRAAYPENFNNVEFYVWFTRRGLRGEEAKALFRRLVERGEVFSTYEGAWRWA